MMQIASEIMLINLKNGFSKKPYVTTEVCKIIGEDTLVYLTNVGGKETVVLKTDTNDVKFVEVYSMVDNKAYWHLDTYVYAEIDHSSSKEQFIEYWVGEIKKRAMDELKAQNAMIKTLYNGIAEITA